MNKTLCIVVSLHVSTRTSKHPRSKRVVSTGTLLLAASLSFSMHHGHKKKKRTKTESGFENSKGLISSICLGPPLPSKPYLKDYAAAHALPCARLTQRQPLRPGLFEGDCGHDHTLLS